MNRRGFLKILTGALVAAVAVGADLIVGNGAKAHYGIQPPDFDFKTINIPLKDAEMLISRQFSTEEIVRVMSTHNPRWLS